MVSKPNSPEVRSRARRPLIAALQSLRRLRGPCQNACPAGVDIQGYLALAALGKFNQAIRLIKDRNPLPAICGRVCTRPCEVKGCRRNLLDDRRHRLHQRYIADLDLGRAQPFRPDLASATGKRIAIVGAGPGGLPARTFSPCAGTRCNSSRPSRKPGHAPLWHSGISATQRVLDQEIGQILDLGVKLSTNVFLGKISRSVA